MLAVVERERSCLGRSSPYTADMPARQMMMEPSGGERRVVVVPKKPLQSSVNQQKLECQEPPLQEPKKGAGRRRVRGKGKGGSSAQTMAQSHVEHIGLDVVAPPVSTKGIGFQRRPGFGVVGTKCIVKANHFLAELPDKDLNHYDVSFGR